MAHARMPRWCNQCIRISITSKESSYTKALPSRGKEILNPIPFHHVDREVSRDS